MSPICIDIYYLPFSYEWNLIGQCQQKFTARYVLASFTRAMKKVKSISACFPMLLLFLHCFVCDGGALPAEHLFK
jgi:hypothetical protein